MAVRTVAIPLKSLKWENIFNGQRQSEDARHIFQLPVSQDASLLASPHFPAFPSVEEVPVCPPVGAAVGLYRFLSVCLTGLPVCLFVFQPVCAVCKKSEGEVKVGEDAWRRGENVRCMTSLLRFGWRAVSRPVHRLAFVYGISIDSGRRGEIPDLRTFGGHVVGSSLQRRGQCRERDRKIFISIPRLAPPFSLVQTFLAIN